MTSFLENNLETIQYGSQLPSSKWNGNMAKITTALTNAYNAFLDSLPLAGGTMTGELDMNTNTISRVKDGADSKDAVNLSQLVNAVRNANPIGTFKISAATMNASYYLLCNGSAISRTTYSDLFASIGTHYGSGDGSTTFNLPNYLGRTFVGAGAGDGLTLRQLGQKGGSEYSTNSIDSLPSSGLMLNTYSGLETEGIAITPNITEGYIVSLPGSGEPVNNMMPYTVSYVYIQYKNIL